jgi:hypothetical protein
MFDEQSGLIVYGYDLGGAATGWKVRETDPVGLTAEWAYDADVSSLEEIMPPVEHLGVRLQPYGNDRERQWLLATQIISNAPTEILDLTVLTESHEHSAWDAALSHALDIVGLTPFQEHPMWLGCMCLG